jgi:hypothetical protein
MQPPFKSISIDPGAGGNAALTRTAANRAFAATFGFADCRRHADNKFGRTP